MFLEKKDNKKNSKLYWDLYPLNHRPLIIFWILTNFKRHLTFTWKIVLKEALQVSQHRGKTGITNKNQVRISQKEKDLDFLRQFV